MKQGKAPFAAIKEAILLADIASAFEEVGADAARIAYGEKGVCDLSPGGRLAKLAIRAADAARETEGRNMKMNRGQFSRAVDALWNCWAQMGRTKEADDAAARRRVQQIQESAQTAESCTPDYPAPLAELSRCVETLRAIVTNDLSKGEGRRQARAFLAWRAELETGRKQTVPGDTRLDLAQVLAWRLSSDCKTCAAVAYHQADTIFAFEIFSAQAAARENSWRARWAKEKGDNETYRKRKQRAKADIYRARVFEAYFLVYKAGMTVKETAEKMKLSLRTVGSLLQKARAMAGAERRKGGRRKSVEADPLKGIEEAENDGSAARWKEEGEDFYRGIDDDLDGAADENEEGF